MPLSDHEQRMLAEIERALYAEDPKFAASVRTTTLRSHYQRRIVRAAIIIVAGLVLLLAGVVRPSLIALGVLGFVFMLVGVLSVVSNVKRMRNGVVPTTGGLGRSRGVAGPTAGPSTGGRGPSSGAGGNGPRPPGKSAGRRGLGGRFHDRWERRWEGRWDDES